MSPDQNQDNNHMLGDDDFDAFLHNAAQDFEQNDPVANMLYEVMGQMREQGATGEFIRLGDAMDMWAELETIRQGHVYHELADEYYLKFENGYGHTRYYDLYSKTGWVAYVGNINTAHYSGDITTRDLLLSVLPDDGELKALATNDIEDISGYPLRPIRQEFQVRSCEIGNRFDLCPGTVDFRNYLLSLSVQEDKLLLDLVGISNELLQAARKAVASNIADDWTPINETLENIRVYYGKDYGMTKKLEIWSIINSELKKNTGASDY